MPWACPWQPSDWRLAALTRTSALVARRPLSILCGGTISCFFQDVYHIYISYIYIIYIIYISYIYIYSIYNYDIYIYILFTKQYVYICIVFLLYIYIYIFYGVLWEYHLGHCMCVFSLNWIFSPDVYIFD